MLAAERGAARNTIAAYRRDLEHYLAYLADHRATPGQARTEQIRDYLRQASRSGLAARSLARRLSALRQFHRFLFAEGIRADDPTAVIESPRQGRDLPKVLNESEIDRLLAAARGGESAEARRLACLIELLYGTGMRVSELVGLPFAAAARQH